MMTYKLIMRGPLSRGHLKIPMRKVPTGIRWHYLSNATCLMRLVCFTCFPSCQGSPEVATLFTTFKEHLLQTSSVRQVVPPDRSDSSS